MNNCLKPFAIHRAVKQRNKQQRKGFENENEIFNQHKFLGERGTISLVGFILGSFFENVSL